MIRAFLIVFSALSASIPVEEVPFAATHARASFTQQNRPDSARAQGASDSTGGGRRGGGAASRSDGPVRTDVEATPGAVGGGASSWLRIFAFILLGLAGLSALVVVGRKLAPRVTRRRQDDELPLVFPVSNHEWQVVNRFPNSANHARPATSPTNAASAPVSTVVANNNNSSGQQHSSVRVPKPIEGTLQLLPGRFEVASGTDRMKEIRFVRTSGPPVITFGRHAGDAPTHVQVDSPTVSRMHASMRFDAGRWHIKNLSGTNPVVVNGEPLPANGTEQMLNDGDQVEMGDMVFLFRSR